MTCGHRFRELYRAARSEATIGHEVQMKIRVESIADDLTITGLFCIMRLNTFTNVPAT
jgi:hypothetical protein